MPPASAVTGQPMDGKYPHRSGRTVAVQVKVGSHPSMVPVATQVFVPGSVIVIPLVVRGHDECLLDHIGFVGIAIRGVGAQVRGVQAGVVGINSLPLFRRVGFGYPVIGTNALDVVHGLKSLLIRFQYPAEATDLSDPRDCMQPCRTPGMPRRVPFWRRACAGWCVSWAGPARVRAAC